MALLADSGTGTGAFPDALFTIEDDPAAVRASTDGYTGFARQARASEEVLTALTVDSWRGSEGDLFRTRRASYEPMMATAAGAEGHPTPRRSRQPQRPNPGDGR